MGGEENAWAAFSDEAAPEKTFDVELRGAALDRVGEKQLYVRAIHEPMRDHVIERAWAVQEIEDRLLTPPDHRLIIIEQTH